MDEWMADPRCCVAMAMATMMVQMVVAAGRSRHRHRPVAEPTATAAAHSPSYPSMIMMEPPLTVVLEDGALVRVARHQDVDVERPLHRCQCLRLADGRNLVPVHQPDAECADGDHLVLGVGLCARVGRGGEGAGRVSSSPTRVGSSPGQASRSRQMRSDRGVAQSLRIAVRPSVDALPARCAPSSSKSPRTM